MCAGPFARIWHWGPLIALGIIKLVTWMTIHCLSMWWPPWRTLGSTINALVFLGCAASTLYYFLNALWQGPGYVPIGWEPEHEEDTEFLQYCNICKGYKAPRSHHCRQCGRCVLKMDHHCPWINGCVGASNHRDFTLFLMFAVLGCLHATVILSCSMYRAINRVWYMHYGLRSEPVVYLTLNSLVMTILSLGSSIGVVLGVGMLFYLQIRGILRNRTNIEDWILEKAMHRAEETGKPYIYPYNLGWRKNFALVMFCSSDGINWPVKEGCHKYSLTIEQLEQKRLKRSRARLYSARRTYSGRWCPILNYPHALLSIPFSGESRLRLEIEDKVWVTRWKKHWLFGELSEDRNEDGTYKRGWFPHAAVIPVYSIPTPKENDTIEEENDHIDEENAYIQGDGDNAQLGDKKEN